MMKREKLEKKKKMMKSEEFELCKVCRINHNQGRRHNFFPRHANSLSSLFSRFQNKLSVVNSAVANPSFNLPDHASSNSRFWCIFCEFDVDELGSSFASGNAIKHLASEDHLKNVKHFLWKYGGGSNKVDSFRVTEAELAKWEKRCEDLKSKGASSSQIYQGSVCGGANDIQLNYGITNSSNKNSIHFLDSSLSNNVLPLQYDTNENYQVSHSDISVAGKVGLSNQNLGSPMPQGSEHGLNTWSSTHLGYGNVHPLPSSATNSLTDDGPVHKAVLENQSTATREASLKGNHQALTRISSGILGVNEGNVYSGAPPPWLQGTEAASEAPARSNRTQKNCKKTSKLNPMRVGAAWAEKRRRELEMEKKGQAVANDSDPNWLPNFGRIWQSGTRKESMKQFKMERVNVPKADSQPEGEIKLHPYISKRMRLSTSSRGAQEGGDTS